MHCSRCEDRGFIPSPEWAEWNTRFEIALGENNTPAAVVNAAGRQPAGPEEVLCSECHGASVPGPMTFSQALRHLKALDVTNPDASVQVTEDFLGRRTVVAQVWNGRDWVRAGSLAEAVRLVRDARTSSCPGNLAEADAAVLEEQFVDLGGEG